MQAARGAPVGAGGSADPPIRRRRRVGVLLALALLIWVIDQGTKMLAVQRLAGQDPVEILGGLLTLRVTRNPGAAFSLAGGMTVLFTAVAVGVVVAVLTTARRLHSLAWAVALGLLLGGALGNLTDRLTRQPGILRGHVVDFLELPHWPVFNVADMAIVSGAATMVLLSLLGRSIDAIPAPAPSDPRVTDDG